MKTHLTTRAVADTLARIAHEHPDHNGEGRAHGSPDMCLYLYEDGTRCIAGQALHDLGVDSRLYDHSRDDIYGVLENELAGKVTYDVDVPELLAAAQDAQDIGSRWAEAVRRAFDKVGVTHPEGA